MRTFPVVFQSHTEKTVLPIFCEVDARVAIVWRIAGCSAGCSQNPYGPVTYTGILQRMFGNRKGVGMSTDPTLLKALKTARSDVNTVIADIRARKDFSKTAGLKTSVTALSAYSQNLLNAETDIPLPDKSATALKAEASDVNTDVLANLINANIAMIGMGQLNMNRTIEPSVAKKDNVHMETSQASNSRLISLLQASSGQTPVVPVKDAVLKELKVTGAEKSETGLYYQFYSENQSVRVLAVTDPNTSGAWEEISWTGGREPSSQAANQRSVSLATLTTVGNPTKVTATVNGKSLSVEIAVVDRKSVV